MRCIYTADKRVLALCPLRALGLKLFLNGSNERGVCQTVAKSYFILIRVFLFFYRFHFKAVIQK